MMPCSDCFKLFQEGLELRSHCHCDVITAANVLHTVTAKSVTHAQTIRENILFGLEYDPDKYDKVIEFQIIATVATCCYVLNCYSHEEHE